jgi:hypothetical protein
MYFHGLGLSRKTETEMKFVNIALIRPANGRLSGRRAAVGGDSLRD